jgi:heme/copper-type cytochrome/quinol oxidase subunit 3
MGMTATTAAYTVPVDGRGTRAPGWWGMILLIITEASLFAYLLFSYFYLGSMQAAWPLPPHGDPDLTLALPNTVILLASSGTMWWGERGIERGTQGRLRLGMLLTLILGVVFLVIQGIEYSHQRFTPATDAYGSLFFTITGFHGAHVAVGLLMNVVVQIWAWRGHFTADRHLAVSAAALYWHFVDVVWLFVFASLYITPRLW